MRFEVESKLDDIEPGGRIWPLEMRPGYLRSMEQYEKRKSCAEWGVFQTLVMGKLDGFWSAYARNGGDDWPQASNAEELMKFYNDAMLDFVHRLSHLNKTGASEHKKEKVRTMIRKIRTRMIDPSEDWMNVVRWASLDDFECLFQ